MRKIIILLTILLAGMVGNANAQGVRFWKGSFEEAAQEAKRQDKLIFIDFYTVWCGPCKSMSNRVFPHEDVGEYFNETFICCKLDAEREGKELAKKYGVSSYPTLLFIKANGEVMSKTSGVISAETLIELGKNTVAVMNDPNSVMNLKKRYEAGDRDEQFLRSYIEKMSENKLDPGAALEEYLKVQKSMKEGSSKMMEFLMTYSDFFILGGEAERILKTNEKEYMDIATDVEEKKVSLIYSKMMNRAHSEALDNKDVAMYELFVDRWLKLPEKPYYQDYNDLRLDLMLLKGNMKDYKKEAITYLDSIVDTRSADQVREEDEKRYEDYCKKNPENGYVQMMVKNSYKNLDAKLQTKAILKVGNQLMKNGLKRKDFKHFPKWIEHGKLLLPDNYEMVNFEANVLYREGKKEKAIELKRKVLGMINPKDRIYPYMKETLQKMEAGTY